MDSKDKLKEIAKRFNFGTMYLDEIEEYGNIRADEYCQIILKEKEELKKQLEKLYKSTKR